MKKRARVSLLHVERFEPLARFAPYVLKRLTLTLSSALVEAAGYRCGGRVTVIWSFEEVVWKPENVERGSSSRQSFEEHGSCSNDSVNY